MRPTSDFLLNTADIELWPARLLRARSNQDARTLARATTVLRRKRDGRYLAAVVPEGIAALMPRWSREPGIDAALDRLEYTASLSPDTGGDLPVASLRRRLGLLGLQADAYAARTGLALVAEPATLAFAGRDRYRRPLWLAAPAARAWQRMRTAALDDGVALEAISGYRSHDYQLGIVQRKLARGQALADILTVNAAPGYSEHHSGRALDLGAPDQPAAEESFEATAAFAWLQRRAGDYGFAMSYPRGNPHGIVYEPWHWAWHQR